MSGFPILDLVVGVIFVYFLLSIICCSIVEIVLTFKKTRAKVLGQWFVQVLGTEVTVDGKTAPLGAVLLDHCSLTALSKSGESPSYVSARNFSTALLEKLIALDKNGLATPDLDGYLAVLKNTTALPEELKQTFIMYANEANDSYKSVTQRTMGAIEMFKKKIEAWYESNMDRITGTLKTEYSRRYTFIAAIVVTFLLNADSISIAEYLYNNPDARAKIAAEAYKTGTDDKMRATMNELAARTSSPGKTFDTTEIKDVSQLQTELAEKYAELSKAKASLDQSLPLGWTPAVKNLLWYQWGIKFIGLVMTVLAVMMGAPFWFDMINKIANIRGAGNKPESGANGSSK